LRRPRHEPRACLAGARPAQLLADEAAAAQLPAEMLERRQTLRGPRARQARAWLVARSPQV